MKIIIAPDSFKGSLSAENVAKALKAGFYPYFPKATYHLIPMSDGGDGFLAAMLHNTTGQLYPINVTGPNNNQITATFATIDHGQTAVIETASASGLELATTKDPLHATSYGTGELIKAALDLGVSKIILGLGGSATNDGGAGLLQALGLKLLDHDGNVLSFGGAALKNLATIKTDAFDQRLQTTKIILASDVIAPFIGPKGASFVFGPQKGASEKDVNALDKALQHFAQVIYQTTQKDITNVSGAGAAGGIAGGLLAFSHAQLQSGVSLMLEMTALSELAQGADLLLTGEGSLDAQTELGKAPLGVLQTVKKVAPNCLCCGIAGQIKDVAQLHELGFDALFSCVPGVVTLTEALSATEQNLTQTATELARFLKKAQNI